MHLLWRELYVLSPLMWKKKKKILIFNKHISSMLFNWNPSLFGISVLEQGCGNELHFPSPEHLPAAVSAAQEWPGTPPPSPWPPLWWPGSAPHKPWQPQPRSGWSGRMTPGKSPAQRRSCRASLKPAKSEEENKKNKIFLYLFSIKTHL